MEKVILENLIELGLSQREMAEKLACSQSTVKHWLKKYGLKSKHNQFNKNNDQEKKCPKCGNIKPISEFYKRNNRFGYGGYCKKCSNEYHTQRVRDVKIKMIQYKGGQCTRCKSDLTTLHYSVFDFHHLNPKEKDPNFTRIKYQNWAKIQNELDKCILVCSNCHRTIHAEINGY